MKFYRYILALGMLAAVAVSCKKEDDDTPTSKSMTGTLVLSDIIPSYVTVGSTFEFTPSGVALDEEDSASGKTIDGYYFKTDLFEKRDTIKVGETYEFTVPDSLALCKLSCVAFAEGYYTKSANISFTIVDKNKSLAGVHHTLTTFTDTRDNVIYNTTDNGTLTWFAANLQYFEKDAEGKYTFGLPYECAPAMESIFGAYYTWNEAKTACPAGWRVPTVADWETLGTSSGALIGNARFNGKDMWEFWPAVKITNSTGFSALPLGYASVSAGSFEFMGLNSYSAFWVDDSGAGQVRYFYVGEDDIKVWTGVSQDSFAAPVRCVKDI